MLLEGERYRIPVDAEDKCFFEGDGQSFSEIGGFQSLDFTEDIKEVKFWVENENGEKIKGDGIVKMEYPPDFFGKETD